MNFVREDRTKPIPHQGTSPVLEMEAQKYSLHAKGLQHTSRKVSKPRRNVCELSILSDLSISFVSRGKKKKAPTTLQILYVSPTHPVHGRSAGPSIGGQAEPE